MAQVYEIPIGKRTLKYRFFEILPGLLSWSILLLPIILSFVDPTSRFAAIFILFFMFSWFYRAMGMAFRTIQGYRRMKVSNNIIDWPLWLRDLENPKEATERLRSIAKPSKEELAHLDNLTSYIEDNELNNLKPSDIIQWVIVPMWKESYEVVAPTLESIADSLYDNKQVIVTVAYEERGGDIPEATSKQLVKDFKEKFHFISAISHPGDLPNEVVGKGGNITWASQQMMPYFDQHKINHNRVIVTTLDADNRPHPDYLAHLAYSYILTHERKYRSFQPLAVYTNNIWDVPAPMRVLAVGNSFFTIVQSVRPHLLRNFSSHAQGLDALVETKFWSTRTVVEDGHQFWRSYFAFKGNHEVIPVYTPIYQDAVLSDTYKATLKAQFVQIQRWAYGASDIPYIANLGFRRKKTRPVPLWDFVQKFARLLDTHVSWGTAALLLLLAARIPLFLGTHETRSIVAHQLPVIASWVQTIALGGLFMSIFLSMKLLPPRPARYKRRRTFMMLLQWVLLPFTSIIYGTCAALYSQTRLMIGKYLDTFALTHKGVKTAPKKPSELAR